MPQCEAIKKDGEQCNGVAKAGYKYCHYHRKTYSKNVRHGRTASPELLGIPHNKQLTFQEFYESQKPFELIGELAYLRTLLVEQREAMEATRPSFRENILRDFATLGSMDLVEAGVSDDAALKILDVLSPRLQVILNEYHGPVEPLSAQQYSMLGDTIERISRTADKAKRIAEGITLNVDFGSVQHTLIRFVREVIMREIRDPDDRARIVSRVREMNLTGDRPVTHMAALPASEDIVEHEEV